MPASLIFLTCVLLLFSAIRGEQSDSPSNLGEFTSIGTQVQQEGFLCPSTVTLDKDLAKESNIGRKVLSFEDILWDNEACAPADCVIEIYDIDMSRDTTSETDKKKSIAITSPLKKEDKNETMEVGFPYDTWFVISALMRTQEGMVILAGLTGSDDIYSDYSSEEESNNDIETETTGMPSPVAMDEASILARLKDEIHSSDPSESHGPQHDIYNKNNRRGPQLLYDTSNRTCGSKTAFRGTSSILFDIPPGANASEFGTDFAAGEQYLVMFVPHFAVPVRNSTTLVAVEDDPTSAVFSVCYYQNTNPEVPLGKPSSNPSSSASPSSIPTQATVSVEADEACFPATAEVTLPDGSLKQMSKLRAGESILANSQGDISDVFMFGHRKTSGQYDFLELSTVTGTILISPSHYLFANGELMTAANLKAGDYILHHGVAQEIQTIATRRETGLYAPHTLAGTLLVNGFDVSCYTQAIHPSLSHKLLAPLRAIYLVGIELEFVSRWMSEISRAHVARILGLARGPSQVSAW